MEHTRSIKRILPDELNGEVRQNFQTCMTGSIIRELSEVGGGSLVVKVARRGETTMVTGTSIPEDPPGIRIKLMTSSPL
ncbi:MAG: hypothetical protein US53_C0052G0009 [Candidatus Woesebacteria bacterium GW2011_GWA1_37_7]|uniref:Uncharacterized protein n=1 Tax=Candidatus Woesebacteria bacterium GW2011_GWA1_37_7 TaxID=1618545 RepID=A0A0G0K714_9BACT|nr:MAG: hypothetical protein US53_C0052G0009 [Candidatus Woesebacteria bacterium GW2011_GWA1_37_7]